jgi:hypothetical protein
MRRNLIIGTITLLLLLTCSLSLKAQGNLKKKVVFPPGQSSMVFKGTIKGQATQQIYLVRVRKGQRLSLLLTSDKRQTTFNVFNSHDNESIGNPPGETQEWENTMEATDEYSIIVTIYEPQITDNYVLRITVK